MTFVDAHAHLTFKESDTLHVELERARNMGIKAILNVCMDSDDLLRGLKLATENRSPAIYLAAACTPHDAARDDDLFYSEVKKCAQNKELIAIGETGLDYFYEHCPKEKQQEVFYRYIALANLVKLPIIIHCRDAFDDLERILDKECKTKVMLHCFTGSLAEAKRAVERGWYVSISGIVTFPKSQSLQEVASKIPLDRLLLETDSPYLAPQGFRGKKNEPSLLRVTAECVARLRNISVAELGLATTHNVETLFEVT